VLGNQVGEIVSGPGFGDGSNIRGQLAGSPDPANPFHPTKPTTSAPFHNGGWDYLFVDGHVKYLRPEQTIGQGVNGSGKDAGGNPCTKENPCGLWTRDDTD
jgi:prepilin-type processing-associated H-X9-DG protein